MRLQLFHPALHAYDPQRHNPAIRSYRRPPWRSARLVKRQAKPAVSIANYNELRPHSSLGYLTPAACSANFTATKDRLRNPTNFTDRPLLPTVPDGVKQAEALIVAGYHTSGSQHVRWKRPRHP